MILCCSITAILVHMCRQEERVSDKEYIVAYGFSL